MGLDLGPLVQMTTNNKTNPQVHSTEEQWRLWYRYSFVPRKMELDGVITYAEGMHRNHDTLMFTFSALLGMLDMIRNECEATSR